MLRATRPTSSEPGATGRPSGVSTVVCSLRVNIAPPWPLLVSMMILSVPPNTRSMVSKYMRVRVTSGAFLYSSYTLRKRAVCPVASATVCCL